MGEEARGLSAGNAIFAIVLVGFTCYLAFAGFQGRYGLLRLFEVEAEENRLRAELASLRAEHESVANKVRRLSTESLDLELLDEQARKVLSLGRPDEIMIP
jgi:cell division protein FtsB